MNIAMVHLDVYVFGLKMVLNSGASHSFELLAILPIAINFDGFKGVRG